MSTTDTDLARAELEQQADLARSRLAGTIDALSHWRHDLLDWRAKLRDWRAQLRKHVVPLVAVGVGLAAALVGSALLGTRAARRRAAHPYRARWEAMQRAWEHPDRVADYKDRPLAIELGRKVTLTAGTLIVTEAIRRAFRHPKAGENAGAS
jgi:hypothetical protein